MVDVDTMQCREDQDCWRFGNAGCDRQEHVCVMLAVMAPPDAGRGVDAAVSEGGRDSTPPGADARASGTGDADDAPACADDSDAGPAGACAGATCVPFDNRTRLTIVGPDGGLRPLP
jgi:hypothetical protein